jgi:hypothetical protein
MAALPAFHNSPKVGNIETGLFYTPPIGKKEDEQKTFLSPPVFQAGRG